MKHHTDSDTPRPEDQGITPSSGNVFLDLGFDPEEAADLALRAELMFAIGQYIEAKGWTQAEAARRMGTTQPRVSDLMRSKGDRFSVDALRTLAAKAGRRVHVTLSEAA